MKSLHETAFNLVKWFLQTRLVKWALSFEKVAELQRIERALGESWDDYHRKSFERAKTTWGWQKQRGGFVSPGVSNSFCWAKQAKIPLQDR